MNNYIFEELILAARDAKLPYSFYANEANSAVFVISHDDFGEEELITLFVENDRFWLVNTDYTTRSFEKAEFAIRAASRLVK